MDWKENLPDNVREWDEAKNSETREAFFKQMENHRSLLGKSIRIPGEDASDEDKAKFIEKVVAKVPDKLMQKPQSDEDVLKFYRTMGMPEDADKYTDPKIEVPDGAKIKEDELKRFKTLAHKHNLTQKQFEGVVADYLTPDLEAAHETTLAEVTARAELKDSWGDKYNSKETQAKMIRDEYFPFIDGEMDTRTTKAMAEIAGKLGVESKGLSDDEKQGAKGMTRDEAMLKISEITNNKEHAYWNASDMGHQAAKRKMRELNVIAYN